MKKERGIRYYPIILFASVMGFAGVTISFQLAEDLYNIGYFASTTMLVLTLLLFILNGTILIYRLVRYYGDVKKDFTHPVKMNFYGTVSISFLLLSVILIDLNNTVSLITWIAGALAQLGLTLLILSTLIWNVSFKITQFNPTWFIPIVGNIVVPLAGIHHASSTINWIFFSIGIIFTIIYLTIFVQRVFFHPPLPAMLTPSYFILLAPLGIGVVSYGQLTGEVDSFAYILYGLAFYLGLLFIFQWKRFIKLPFFLSWWAYLFPTAAVTNATIYMYQATGEDILMWIIPVQLVGLLVLSAFLFIKTIKVARSGILLLKED